MESKFESVQTFGRKVILASDKMLVFVILVNQFYSSQKTATAVAFCKRGTGLIKVNGAPISLLQPEILRLKTFEPILLLGSDKFAEVIISEFSYDLMELFYKRTTS